MATPVTISLAELEPLAQVQTRWIPLSIPRACYPTRLTREGSQMDLVSSLRQVLNNSSAMTAAEDSRRLAEIIRMTGSAEEMTSLASTAVEATLAATEGLIPTYLQVLAGVPSTPTRNWAVAVVSHLGRMISSGYEREAVQQCAQLKNGGPAGMETEEAEELYAAQYHRLRSATQMVALLYRHHGTTLPIRPAILHGFYQSQMTTHATLVAEMEELGDPYLGECQDPEAWTILETMRNIYQDSLMITVSLARTRLAGDTRGAGGRSMSQIPARFWEEVAPHITRGWCRRQLAGWRSS